MNRREYFRYYSSNLNETEVLVVYNDEIVLEKSNKNITGNGGDTTYRISIKDVQFISTMIIGNVFGEYKEAMKESYNKVRTLEPSQISRVKNTSRKDLTIQTEEFNASVDMFIDQYDDVFSRFVETIKDMVISKF